MNRDYFRYDLGELWWDDAPPYTYSPPIRVRVPVDVPNSAVVSSDWQQDLLLAVRVNNNGRSLNLRLANLDLVSEWEELPYEYLFESCRAASKVKDEKLISQESVIANLQVATSQLTSQLGIYEAIQQEQKAFSVELTAAQKTLCSLSDEILGAAADQLSLG